MRCACPFCGVFMPQSGSRDACVCPDCGYVCAACVSRNLPKSIEEIRKMAADQAFAAEENPPDSN
ncbi:MAG: hypothetical protein GX611_07680 [Clostridiales bacterium]|nr:hypothetical protein [Clostridiales bacterium]